ncbi:hypothetical protein L7F22_060914 [Adiantum nelumboides]|nr:hypothetical protein [Adiantum nelumboides]
MKGKERLFPKLSMRYYGPFQVCDIIIDVAYRLKLPKSWKIHNAFHVSLLRPYVGDVPEDMPAEHQPEVEELDEILVSEQILAHKDRKLKGKVARCYLVKFRNYPPMDAKWMEEGELAESPIVLSQQDGTSKNKRKDDIVANVAAAKCQKEVSESDAYAPAAGLEKGKTATIKLVENTAKAPSPMHMQISVNKAKYEGLKKLFSKNKKAFKKHRPQILVSLWSSLDSCRLSLKVFGKLEGVDKICVCNCASYACILLLECLSEVISDPVLGVDFIVVPSDVKEIVRSMARCCNSLLDNRRCDNFPIASQVFLQLLATFGIGTDFKADDILDFVVAMSRRGLQGLMQRWKSHGRSTTVWDVS